MISNLSKLNRLKTYFIILNNGPDSKISYFFNEHNCTVIHYNDGS